MGLLDTALDSAVSASVAGEAIVSVARLAALSPTVSPFPPPLLLLQRQWYERDSEYYLLQFTLTVRCLFYTSFSLELCRQPVPAPAPAQRTPSSFLWLLAYVFYYPVFHNGPILNFPEFFKQVELSGGPDEFCVPLSLLDCEFSPQMGLLTEWDSQRVWEQ